LEMPSMPRQSPLDIAITGIACRFPGNCNTLPAFQCLMQDQRCGIVRNDAWVKQGAPEMVCQAGFISDKDMFDPSVFGLSGFEITYMDTQQLMALECVYEALLDSGFDPRELAGRYIPVVAAVNHLRLL